MIYEKKWNQYGAFTLIEILVSIAIVAVLAGISTPVYNTFIVRQQVLSTTELAVKQLRTAQVQAQNMKEDSAWGMYIENGTSYVYKGTSFQSRDQTYDQIVEVSESVAISGTTDISFEKLSGRPEESGTITISQGSTEKSIIISSSGIISIQ